MQTEADGNRICWDEFSAEEALVVLRRIAAELGGQAVSGFLDAHQWVPLARQPGVLLDGGHPQAQFRRAALGMERIPLAISRCAMAQLPPAVHTARQLRSWLYRQEIPDSSLGDIVVTDHLQLVTDPRVGLAVAGLTGEVLPSWSEPRVAIKRATAAGPRADAVTAAVFGVSRGEAQTAIKHGFLFADYSPVEKRTQTVAAGQHLVFRTKGRAALERIEPNQRSGRIWVDYRLYPC
jgi:hypothetical protein